MAAEETLKWAPKFIGSMEIAGLAAEIGGTIGRMESERFLEKHPAVKEDYPLSAALGTLILEDSDLTLDDMKALAKNTLREAERLYGGSDDMTVVTVRVEERV